MASHPTQEEVDDILGAALDALDDLDGGRSDDEQQPSAATSTEPSGSPPDGSAQESTQNKVYFGPEPPPPAPAGSAASSPATKTSSASKQGASLEDTMSQLLRAGEALQKSAGGVGDADDIDLEGAEKMLDEIMGQLQLGGLGDLMGGLDETGNDNKSSADTTKSSKATTTKKAEEKKSAAGTAEPKASGSKSSAKKKSAASSTPKANGNGSPSSTEADVDRAVQRLLSDMAKAGTDDDDAIPDLDALMNGGNMEAMGEEMMESMMKELSAFGASGDADDVVDGMMRQLLSKDLMYEPMKQVCDRFPAWLAESKAQLSEEEYQKYGTQYQYFQRIVHTYETDPENFPRLMELMQEIQKYGQPPADIIKELAPGLEFDEEGMPKMDGQMPGMPFPPGVGGDECSIM